MNAKGKRDDILSRHGFTLVEIMIVVAIIALLAVLALPSFMKARLESKVAAQKNDFRILEAAFQLYAMEHQGFPAATWVPGVLPPGMSAYMRTNVWIQTAPLGGNYAWKLNAMSGTNLYYISLSGNVDQQGWDLLDQQIDDGNPSAGRLETGPADHSYFLDQ